MRLETPAEVRREEKYICPHCNIHRWWSKKKVKPLQIDTFYFTDYWGCRNGCLGMNIVFK